MKTKAALSALLAFAVAGPALIAPSVAPSMAPVAQAQAEYPDVPLDHWAYNAINSLSQAGIIEGYPNGQFNGGRAMTRYEFAVAIARLLQSQGGSVEAVRGERGERGEQGPQGPAGAVGPVGPRGADGTLANLPEDLVRRAELNDAIAALRNEFRDELATLGVRVDDLDNRVTALENRVVRAPRLTVTPSFLHRTGAANYIRNDLGGRTGDNFGRPGGAGVPGGGAPGGAVAPGFFRPNNAGLSSNQAFNPALDLNTAQSSLGRNKFSYTDFELRLTDRVTERLSVNAALRSISGTDEDPWLLGHEAVPNPLGVGPAFVNERVSDPTSVFLREVNAVANVSDNFSAILGRQRTKVAQGLLYDNDLWTTDQLQANLRLGMFNLTGFIGSANNNTSNTGFLAGRSNYLNSGAVGYMGSNFFSGALGGDAAASGAFAGFPGAAAFIATGAGGNVARTDDNEALVRASFNLFRIGGQPVQLGASYLFDGIADQSGYGADLTIPLFNRNVGIEYVRQQNYAFDLAGTGADSDGRAFNITVPVLRTNALDLNFAYGRANDEFEYFVASSANPFARTYGEAIFDRQMALGAPLVNGDGEAGDPQYMAAKRVYDIGGTLRIIRSLPLDFRYYRAKGTENRDLGDVWTVGSSFNLTQGVDLEVKYGQYNPRGDFDTIKYFRVGANVGF